MSDVRCEPSAAGYPEQAGRRGWETRCAGRPPAARRRCGLSVLKCQLSAAHCLEWEAHSGRAGRPPAARRRCGLSVLKCQLSAARRRCQPKDERSVHGSSAAGRRRCCSGCRRRPPLRCRPSPCRHKAALEQRSRLGA
eukprot:351875-Chlamydomonas_euryale.AAC.1